MEQTRTVNYKDFRPAPVCPVQSPQAAATLASRSAVPALLTGATVWGLIWYPYRVLEAAGLSGVAAAVLTYLVALVLALLFYWRRLRATRWSLPLLAIGLSAGATNLGYVLATLQGEVIRVLLLFYLSPLWTILLARLLLGEHLTRVGGVVMALSLSGAAVMLWHPQLGSPLPGNAAEWIGLGSGFCFALSNVLIRRTREHSIEVKSTVVFIGVAALGLLLMPWLGVGTPPRDLMPWLLVLIVGGELLLINVVVQHGLMHTPANRAIVIFLFELVVAALSAWLLAGEDMELREWIGGAMIVAASLFSARMAPK